MNGIGPESAEMIVEQLKKENAELRLRLDNALYAETDYLEKMVEQRTSELVKAKEAAEAASRAKCAFLANMSHEIRTPLNAMLGFAQLLVREPRLTEQQSKYVSVINRSGEHLLELINDILEMAKIEADHAGLEQSTMDLHTLLDDIEVMFSMRAEDKGLGLTVKTDGAVPRWVTADKKKLRQILINLIGNAIKFTERGGITVSVAARREGSGRWWIVISVEDTGCGIVEEDYEKIFDAFEQSSQGTLRGGTGLGLAISRFFARLMGGDIFVSSRRGEGSVFSLHIIAGAVSGMDDDHHSQRRATGLHPESPVVRILVADDRKDNREVLVKLLSSIGFEIREAEDGKSALEMALNWRPHVVLMDVKMPGMDGFETTRRIKSIEAGQEIKTLVLTSQAFREDERSAIKAGAVGYMTKPFKADELLERIRVLTGVIYIYAEELQNEDTCSRTDPLLTQEGLSVLPREWRDDLRAAAIAADLSQLRKRVHEIEEEHPVISKQILSLISGYDYDGLIHLLG